MLLAACATNKGPPPPLAAVNIFISPAGEPFHAGAGAAYPLDAWFAKVDANHDGAITQEEFLADFRRFFRTIDENHDGVITGDELSDYEQKTAPEILPRIGRLTAADIPPLPDTAAGQRAAQQQDAPIRQRGVETNRGAAIFALTAEPEPVAAADTDFDGKVTLEEFLAAGRRRFAMLDKLHDGRLTRAELPVPTAEKLADKRKAYDERRRK